MKNQETNDAAKKLAELGAKKGGKARATVLTPEERSEISRNAVIARWQKAGKLKKNPEDYGPKAILESPLVPPEKIIQRGPEAPYSLFRGKLRIGALELECHVLNDHRRVFTQREMVRVLSGGRESGDLKGYLDANPLIPKDFHVGRAIPFLVPGAGQALGSEATHLIDICQMYLEAYEQGLLKKPQHKLAFQAGVLIRACAKTGIIALIDEATGFQESRAKQALQIKLQAFIAEELQEWVRMFPTDFWIQLARLEGVSYSPKNRPLRWGKYVMAFVYDAIDPDVGKKLREINPDPHYKKNHHQWLRDFGKDKLREQIGGVVAIMKLCHNMDDFKKRFEKVFGKGPKQLDWEYVFGFDNA